MDTGIEMKPAVKKASPDTEFYFQEGCFIVELQNDPDDPQVSIARARVETEKTTRWHRLIDTAERYVILEGSGRVEIGELPAHDVGVGDVVVIPPGFPQRITNTGNGDLLFLAICTPAFRPAAYVDIQDSLS